jgi:uncharacterized protein (TIGR02118 family)
VEEEETMVKVSVLYPSKAGSRFDVDYYLTVHMPLSVKLLGPALKAASAEIGVHGVEPGATAPYAAIAGFTCESVEAFNQAFMPIAAQLLADIPKYTDIQPVIQFGELTQFAV